MYEIEGQKRIAEQASGLPPSPRARKRRADQSSEVGHPSHAEQAVTTAPASLDTDQPAEGQIARAEQARPITPSPVDTIMALQRRRRFILKMQSKINRALESYLAARAGYSPNLDAKERKRIFAEVAKVVKAIEADYSSAAKAAERAGQAPSAEQARSSAPARKSSRKGSREGQNPGAEQATIIPPSLPLWADYEAIVTTYLSRAGWDKMLAEIVNAMRAEARKLPVHSWWIAIRGTGDLGLAMIVGEAGDVGSYRDKSALWKRCGMAVIDGGRQRKVAGDAAMAHGYSPSRRSEFWNIGDSLFRAQWRGADDDTGRAAGPIGPYGESYRRRREYLAATKPEMKPGHANNEAKRYMTKALLRDLRAAWRAATV